MTRGVTHFHEKLTHYKRSVRFPFSIANFAAGFRGHYPHSIPLPRQFLFPQFFNNPGKTLSLSRALLRGHAS